MSQAPDYRPANPLLAQLEALSEQGKRNFEAKPGPKSYSVSFFKEFSIDVRANSLEEAESAVEALEEDEVDALSSASGEQWCLNGDVCGTIHNDDPEYLVAGGEIVEKN